MKKLQCFLLMSEHSFLPSVVFLIISQGLKMVTGIVVAWAHLRSMLITDLCVVRAGSLQTLYSQFLELCLLLGFCRWIVLLHWRWGEGKKYFSFPFLSFHFSISSEWRDCKWLRALAAITLISAVSIGVQVLRLLPCDSNVIRTAAAAAKGKPPDNSSVRVGSWPSSQRW